MRHIVYSLATFALVANGASTSTSNTVSSPPMAPAAPIVPAAPQSGSTQAQIPGPIIPTLQPVGASASGSAGGASGSASGSAGGGMGAGGSAGATSGGGGGGGGSGGTSASGSASSSGSGSANANSGSAGAGAGAGAGASASSGGATAAPAGSAGASATTSAPAGTATAIPASGDSTTAGPGDTSGTTSAPGGTATAVPAGPSDATAAPAGTTAAPNGATAAPDGATAAPDGATAAPNGAEAAGAGASSDGSNGSNGNGLAGPTASIDTPAALTKGALLPPSGFLPNVLPTGIATVSNLIPGPLVGYLNNAWVRNWNTIWTGTWWGNLIGYGNVNLPLLGPLNVYAPQTLPSWTLGNPANRYGPNWGTGTMVYPALSAQSWWSSGQRFSWSFLPLPTIPGWTFSNDMRGCILNEIEKRVQIYDPRIAPGWLVPGNNTPLATDIAWGYTNNAYWLSWVLPFGAPNTPLSNQNFVAPILSILKTPEFYSAIENGCHIPFSNFTVLSKEIKYQSNSWATTDSARVDMTDPIVGAAPSSFSPFQIMAIPFISLAALLRGN